MPRYFFHVCNGTGFTEDEEGREVENAEAARHIAIKEARVIMADELRDGVMHLSSFIEVQLEGSGDSFVVPFSDAVEIRKRD
ncbi:MAG: hypothetical protein ABIW83_05645 [Allosphingosinicella sp.]